MPRTNHYSLPERFRQPRRDLEELKALFRDLQDKGASFHFDDRSELLDGDYRIEDGTHLFDPEEACIIDEWLAISDRTDWGEHGCHHGYMIALLHEINADHWYLGQDEVGCLGRERQEVCVVDVSGPSGHWAVVLDYTGNTDRFHTLVRTLEHPDARVLVIDGLSSYFTVSQALNALQVLRERPDEAQALEGIPAR